MGSIALSTLPWNMRSIASTAKESNTLFGNIARTVDEVADWANKNTLGRINTNSFLGRASYITANAGVKTLSSMGIESLTETALEEVPQFIATDLYLGMSCRLDVRHFHR